MGKSEEWQPNFLNRSVIIPNFQPEIAEYFIYRVHGRSCYTTSGKLLLGPNHI